MLHFYLLFYDGYNQFSVMSQARGFDILQI